MIANSPVTSMHALSLRLGDASTIVPSPPPASARIQHRPFATLLKDNWNEQTASIYGNVRSWEGRAQEWGRKLFYETETQRDST